LTRARDALFAALSDPTRRAIFERLINSGETNVKSIAQRSGVSQPAVSRHLDLLKNAGLVRGWRDGRQTHYSAEPHALKPLVEWVDHYGAYWRSKTEDIEGPPEVE
jgi:DNA-binding transcriptional ArsR family regulator